MSYAPSKRKKQFRARGTRIDTKGGAQRLLPCSRLFDMMAAINFEYNAELRIHLLPQGLDNDALGNLSCWLLTFTAIIFNHSLRWRFLARHSDPLIPLDPGRGRVGNHSLHQR